MNVPYVAICKGVHAPRLALGMFRAQVGADCVNWVSTALEIGFRHFDTASVYGNENELGAALQQSGVQRDEVFISTKIWNSDQRDNGARDALLRSLDRLRVGWVDLYLIHWPVEERRNRTWLEFGKLQREGLCRAIGVSNFTIPHLEMLEAETGVRPAINQFEAHPFLAQNALRDYCHSKGIRTSAHSALARGLKLEDPRLRISSIEYGCSPVQLMLGWALAKNDVAVVKSSQKAHLAELFEVSDIEFRNVEVGLSGLDCGFRCSWDPTEVC